MVLLQSMDDGLHHFGFRNVVHSVDVVKTGIDAQTRGPLRQNVVIHGNNSVNSFILFKVYLKTDWQRP